MKMTRWLVLLAACACLAGVAGCKHTSNAPKGKTTGPKPVKSGPEVTLGAGLGGQVFLVNPGGQYVVVTFHGPLPAPEQKLGVYRGLLKVGEVRVPREEDWSHFRNGPRLAMDIVAGEAKVGDDVRPE
jgi:hypothetical protein